MMTRTATCEMCDHAAREGWWGVSGVTHCRRCHRTWRGLAQAHCVRCCRHFSSMSAAELHDRDGRCRSDQTLKRRGLVKTRDHFGVIWKHRPPQNWSWRQDG